MALIKAKFLDQYDFSGGINLKDPPDRLKENEAYCNRESYEGTLNVYFDGSVKRRLGTLLKNDVPDPAPTRIDNGIRFYRSAAPTSTWFYSGHYAGETKIGYINGTTLTPVTGGSSLSADVDCYFTPWLDKLYVASGDQVVQVISYSGGWSRNDIVGLTSAPQFIVHHKDRLWAAGGNMDDGYFEATKYNDSEEWAAGEGEAFYAGYKAGDTIMRLMPLGNNLLIFGKSSIWIMRGDNLTNWFQEKEEEEIGLLSSKAVADIGNETLIFVGSDENVWLFRDDVKIRIGDNIQYWIKNIPTARKQNISATFSGDFFRMAFTQSGGSVNDMELCLDVRTLQRQVSSWWPNTGRSISCYIPAHGPGDEKTLYMGDDNASYIRQVDTGSQDDGSNIAFSVQSGYHTMGLETVEKTYNRFKCGTTQGVGNYSLTIYRETSNEYTQTFTLDSTTASVTFGNATLGATYYQAQGQSRMTHEVALPSIFDGHAISYKLTQEGNFANVEFFGATLDYKGKMF